MQDFIPGQRWISDTELQHGLGTVLKTDQRSVTIVFMATGETRTYAKETAPLTRARFSPGDAIRSHAGWTLVVASVAEHNGLFTYHGTRDNQQAASLKESELDNFIQLNKPIDRLFSGQIDPGKWFELRYQTLLHVNAQLHSEIRGMIGGRTSLIPHQLYIAHEVANRYAPRVLLADEVGLGKTIEAGMILHQQLITERASRVLIVVPDTLLHQWLVEMLRRFNLRFSIFDEERCLADEESATQENPFHTEQLVLCSLDFLVRHPQRFQQALAGTWDMLVVDEAHHLQWTPQQASPEYLVVEALSRQTKGVLLLTATPEQLGKAGHFARLRLLDSNRFSSFENFLEDERHYAPVAQAIEELLHDETLSEPAYQTLLATIDEVDNSELLNQLQADNIAQETKSMARMQLVEHLLDRHGTGRVLFRNTRAAVKGFPQRTVTSYPLPLPAAYQACLADLQSTGISHPQDLLSLELVYQNTASRPSASWTLFDPRIDWLAGKLKELRPEKVLVITSSARSALDIADELRKKQGIHAAIFHEGLTIVERDRAAAYFADRDAGTQVLICSEIGSEGRNFQFAHHMVLFDLPYNPDLLEQRIGRLDRIGQTQAIQIHIPFLGNSPQQIMFQWYHEGLSAFEHTCPAGHSVFVRVESTLLEALHQIDEGIEDLPALINTTKKLHQELNAELQKGRDRLLESNSCRTDAASRIKEQIQIQDNDPALQNYLEKVFDCHGIEAEIHGSNSFVLHPGPQTDLACFPGLHEEGATITFDRHTALMNEDMQFITWEHPMVMGAADMILSNERGNTALCAINHKNIQPGNLLVETVFILESMAKTQLQVSRYLPLTAIRLVIDGKGKDIGDRLTHDTINQHQSIVPPQVAAKVVKSHKKEIRELIQNSEALARRSAPAILANARQHTRELLQREINRLKALQQVNPNVRNEEIEYFEHQHRGVIDALESAVPRLDALRVIVST
ncbi:MAG: RNA polymerase-associated protein RapA [Gammaproteobacteria bacterium]|nr:RNA polymerase-associated protein RapA [Gammaproteobacteria bacterium]